MKKGLLFVLWVLPFFTIAQPPAGYYNGTTGLNCSALKTALKNIITTGHVNQGYSALWTQYQVSDIKLREVPPPAGVSNSTYVIWDIYSDNPTGTDPYNFTPGEVASGGQQDNGTSGTSEGQRYNREHSVPLSWHSGSTSSFSGSDYHHVFPTDKKVNAERANWPYGKVAVASFTSLNGSKLGSSAIAGISGTVFEPIDQYKGDVARAFLYFVTRYEDDMPAWGVNPDGAQAFEPNTFPSVDIPYLRLMIQWHNLDPVSQKEIDRNNAGYGFQGNRNPFVDHPEYVSQAWNASCPGLGALPVDLVSFGGTMEGDAVVLSWEVANEIAFDRYELERSFNGTVFNHIATIKAENKTVYRYKDPVSQHSGRRIYYRLKKVNKDGSFSYSAVFSLHVPVNTRFSVYPNPANSLVRITLHGNAADASMVRMTDLAGKTVLVKTISASATETSLDVSRMPAGVYQLKLVLKNGESYSRRLVITR